MSRKFIIQVRKPIATESTVGYLENGIIFFETFTSYCLIICGKVVPLHRFTHAEPTLQNVGAAIGREHYILEMRR